MKIAFVAMSGIRAWDKELLAMGLTMPGFVERSQVIASLPSLGLLTLAGCTPAEHELSYCEYRDDGDTASLPVDADVVVISSLSAQIFEAYAVADSYRQRGVIVIMGGLHVTALPEEALEHCDAVCVGEGEITWPEILMDLEEKGALSRKIYSCDGREFNLNDAPMPAFHLLKPELYNRLTVQTSRGCPHRCSFCAGSIMLTEKYKQKPMAKVLAEIDAICAIWPNPFIEFADDNSFLNKKYWLELFPELQKRGIRWFAESDIAVGADRDFLVKMRQSGCAQILIGLESPDADSLYNLEERSNWKQKSLVTYGENVARIQAAGIRVIGCFIVGLDTHDQTIFDRTYDYVEQLQLYDVQVTLPTPFPGTPFYKSLKEAGRLLAGFTWDKCTLFDLTFEPKNFSQEELRSGFRELIQRLFAEDFTRTRRASFNAGLRKVLKERLR